jgi:hypothetical protein
MTINVNAANLLIRGPARVPVVGAAAWCTLLAPADIFISQQPDQIVSHTYNPLEARNGNSIVVGNSQIYTVSIPRCCRINFNVLRASLGIIARPFSYH